MKRPVCVRPKSNPKTYLSKRRRKKQIELMVNYIRFCVSTDTPMDYSLNIRTQAYEAEGLRPVGALDDAKVKLQASYNGAWSLKLG